MRSTTLPSLSVLCVCAAPAFAQQTVPDDAPALQADATALPINPAPEPQPLTISTDRPSFSDGVGIVPKGHLQLESGWTLTYRDDDSADSTRNTVPELLVRYGVLEDRFELRVQVPSYNWTTIDEDGGDTTDIDGWSDMGVAFKLRLVDQNGFVPTIAILAGATLPTGSEDYSTRHVDPIAKFIWNYDLGKGFGLGGNANLNYPSARGEDHWAQGQASVYVTYAPRWDMSFFLEYYAIFPVVDGGGTSQTIDFGATYLLTRRIQIDGRVGFGLTDASDDVFVGAGLSVLF